MLGKVLGFRCSRQSEQVLAFAYLQLGEGVVSLASCLGGSDKGAVLGAARALCELPADHARELCFQCLQASGLGDLIRGAVHGKAS